MLDVWPCIRPSMNSCLCIASYCFFCRSSSSSIWCSSNNSRSWSWSSSHIFFFLFFPEMRLCWSVFNSSCCCCYCYMRALFNSASVAASAASTSRRAPAPRAVTRPPASASVKCESMSEAVKHISKE
ncbi:hypothetical protein VPH35_058329 [Triticum aestivum]